MKQPQRFPRPKPFSSPRRRAGRANGFRAARPLDAVRFETLETRLMLASDLGLDTYLPPALSAPPEPSTQALSPAAGPSAALRDAPAEGENTPERDLVAFAQLLAATPGVKYFAAVWCPACNAQKALFEDGADYLPFIEVTNPDRTLNATGIAENITSFPTWEFPDGSRETGVQSLDTIAARAGVTIPTGVDPFVAPIGNLTVYGGSPLHVALNGYDPNGGPLTFTVVSSNPALVAPTVLTGNRSARINVTGWGTMVFQLFEDSVPRATERFITLAESGFYDAAHNNPPVRVHRVIDDFVLQFGDPTGTGAGGSTLGNFADHFHPDLQHNTAGALSWAKSTDDTNNSQVFVTDVPTRFLDFNHSYFGQLTEGDSVRNGITATATNSSDQPLVAVNIDSVEIFTDVENAIVMLKAPEGASGEADITVTVTDEDGNDFVRTFHVTVAPDPYNGGPYLADIPPVRTVVNTPATFTLTAVDVEGDPVQFSGIKTGTVDYAFSVDSQTGAVSVTPPAGFMGTLNLIVRVRPATTSDTADLYDSQLVPIVVAPPAPAGVDLLAGSDSGALHDDDLTNQANLDFVVTGVTSGAVVRLHQGSQVLGQATASGPSVTVTTSALSSLGDGTYGVFATQVINGVESDPSSALAVTLDTAPPAALTSAPPTTAAAGALLTYDAQSPDEGGAGLAYALVGAPAGATIDAATGVLTWTPSLAQVGTHEFAVTLTDAAGNSQTQELDVEVTLDASLLFRLEVTNASGVPISTIDVGQDFLLNVYVQDVRPDPQGVFAAYVDIQFDPARVAFQGQITFGPQYQTAQNADVATPGLVNETGGTAGFSLLGGSEYLLFRVPLRGMLAGPVTFTSDPSDVHPLYEVLLFGLDDSLPEDEMYFGAASLTIEPPFHAIDDAFTVAEDSTSNVLDVLANDEVFAGSPGNLTIASATSPSQGGSVAIAPDGLTLLYTPAPDYFGAETFSYTVSDGTGTRTANVTVDVTPVNDNPVAGDDVFTVTEGAVGAQLDVLANDTLGPDIGETLTITGVSNVSAGGAVVVATGGTHLLYTPAATFQGVETFTYTISDGHGGTAQAQVAVTVTDVNNPPLAQNDLYDVLEDSADNVLNVLSNDSTLNDPGETLTITAVTSPDQGGTVSIAGGGTSLRYTPAANFFGLERLSYTISDGRGGTAQASVVITVQGVNDPPTATDDTFTVVKNTTANPLPVLTNDSSAPDGPETLIISAVGPSSAGGTVTIAADGLSLSYTPATNFSGVDTFTYTLRDPGGLTSQATVRVTVADFIPSSIAGYVYLDVNDSGTKDPTEAGIGGVTVALQGTTAQGAAVSLQQETDARGFYRFLNLAPGTYTLTETQPSLLLDGIDSPGNLGTRVANDQLRIELPQDVQATNFNFGERGRTAAHISVFDFFASTPRNTVLLHTTTTGDGQWYAIEGGWEQLAALDFTLQPAQGQLQITATTTEPANRSGTLSLTNPTQIHSLGANGSSWLMLVLAAPESLLPAANAGGHALSPITDADAAANRVAENAAVGAPVGITALATDQDPTDTVSYALDDSAGGRFAIHSTTGVVSLAGALDREQAAAHDIIVRATSSDGSFSTRTFTIALVDVNEFAISAVTDVDGAPNFILETASVGTLVGITASAVDQDATATVSYALDDSAGGRFAIHSTTGVVSLAGAIDHATAASHTIVVRATSSDGSSATQEFVVEVGREAVFTVVDADAAANFVLENTPLGTAVGITAGADGLEGGDAVIFSLDADAQGRFAIDPVTGVVTVAGAIDREVAESYDVTVRATHNGGAWRTQTFTIAIGDVNESPVSAITDGDPAPNRAAENATIGTLVGVTAQAHDPDATNTVAFSLDDDAEGRFAVDPVTGVVRVAAALDYETAASHDIVVRATSSDGSFRTATVTILVENVPGADGEYFVFRLEAAAADGTPLSTVAVGDHFRWNVYVQDIRPDPQGAFAAFLDLVYDPALVQVDGPVTYGPQYPNMPSADLATPGLVDEAGALAGIAPLGGGEYLLLSVPLQAIQSGVALFSSNPSDHLPINEVLLYGEAEGLPPERMYFGSTSLIIQPDGEGELASATSAAQAGFFQLGQVRTDRLPRPPAVLLMAPTPADAYAATDLLLAGELSPIDSSALASVAGEGADYAATVDDLMGQWSDVEES